jgi:hypothetical protein
VVAEGGGLRVWVMVWVSGLGDPPWPLDQEGGRGGCRTGGGGGVWAKRQAVSVPPSGVVGEAGWAGSTAVTP